MRSSLFIPGWLISINRHSVSPIMYLIDGNNLIGHTKSISYHDPLARQKLLDRLMPFLESKRHKATVVFDGPSQPLQKNHWIQLVFAGYHCKADDRIRHIVEKAQSPKEICVVSSDNPVYSYARTCGTQAMKCHEFNRLFHELKQPAAGEEKRELPVGDIKKWLRYFGEEE
jgi:predicted RNA-binding protein with PIN domain